jgi:N utilization substance protein B
MTDENKPVASDNVPPDSVTPKSAAPKSIAKARGKSRRLAMQAIYQWQMTGDSITDIKQQFVDENNFSKVDAGYFSELVSGVAGSISELDPYLEKNMSRSVESVDPVERSILRLGVYEFIHRIDVPYRVVLNEAISITKEYCAENSHTFVNAVLDKVAKEIRHVEVKARASEKPSSK